MSTYTKLLTREVMAACDGHTMDVLGIPSRTLMERAAKGVLSYMEARSDIFPLKGSHTVILCGSGNNGGDGFALARFLAEGGDTRVSVCYVGKLMSDGSPDVSRMSVECAKQYELLKAVLVPVFAPQHMIEVLSDADIVVDAILGIGLDREVRGELAALIELLNRSNLPVLAVDVPTGVCANTGKILGYAVKATATVTMQALKVGMLLYPAADFCGDIHVCDIGVDLTPAQQTRVYLADRGLLRQAMPPRSRRSHKGTYGQIALVCGSTEMCGAAILAAKGAMRSGAGLIRIVTPTVNKTALHSAIPEVIVSCYDKENPLSRQLLGDICGCDGTVIGCGLGTDQRALDLLAALLDNLPIDEHFPVVLDADALNLIAKHPHLWGTRLLRKGCGQVVITPHPMELARLTGASVADILADPVTHASGFAKDKGIVVVLKDAHTVIASPDGAVAFCPYGNAGMAKGGSGDVLAGILGSLCVQRRQDLGDALPLWVIATAGVALHALSGDLAAELRGEYAVTPSDIADAIGDVSKSFSETRTKIEI